MTDVEVGEHPPVELEPKKNKASEISLKTNLEPLEKNEEEDSGFKSCAGPEALPEQDKEISGELSMKASQKIRSSAASLEADYAGNEAERGGGSDVGESTGNLSNASLVDNARDTLEAQPHSGSSLSENSVNDPSEATNASKAKGASKPEGDAFNSAETSKGKSKKKSESILKSFGRKFACVGRFISGKKAHKPKSDLTRSVPGTCMKKLTSESVSMPLQRGATVSGMRAYSGDSSKAEEAYPPKCASESGFTEDFGGNSGGSTEAQASKALGECANKLKGDFKGEATETLPEVSTPGISTPEIPAGMSGVSGMSAPEVSTPEVSTPEVSTPEVSAGMSAPEVPTGMSTPEVPTGMSTPEASALEVPAGISTPEAFTPEASTPESLIANSISYHQEGAKIESSILTPRDTVTKGSTSGKLMLETPYSNSPGASSVSGSELSPEARESAHPSTFGEEIPRGRVRDIINKIGNSSKQDKQPGISNFARRGRPNIFLEKLQ